MVTDWITAISTSVLVIVTIVYVVFTRSLAQSGKEPALVLQSKGVFNILFQIEIQNVSEFFAKDVQVKYIFNNGNRVFFEGAKVIFPNSAIKCSEIYQAVHEPSFQIAEGDIIQVSYKSIFGKGFQQNWEYCEEEHFLDQTIPSSFKLVDIRHKGLA